MRGREWRDARASFGAPGNADRCQMREKVLAITDHEFQTEAGASRVAGAAPTRFRVRDG
jgi:hypothetical protein